MFHHKTTPPIAKELFSKNRPKWLNLNSWFPKWHLMGTDWTQNAHTGRGLESNKIILRKANLRATFCPENVSRNRNASYWPITYTWLYFFEKRILKLFLFKYLAQIYLKFILFNMSRKFFICHFSFDGAGGGWHTLFKFKWGIITNIIQMTIRFY